jgi:ubiquitin fusion degradation protein 1
MLSVQITEPNHNLEHSSYIKLPVSILIKLLDSEVAVPYTFKLTHVTKSVFASVLDFDAPDDTVIIPPWMARHLDLDIDLDQTPDQKVTVDFCTIPKGVRIKVQAQHTDFLNIPDVKETLEHAFRSYPVLTKDSIISFVYESKVFEILIEETHAPEASDDPDGPPDVGISLIDTDLEVDFSTPKGYVEPKPFEKRINISNYIFEVKHPYKPFGGHGTTLNNVDTHPDTPSALRLPPGMLFFGYPVFETSQKASQ